MVAASRRFGWKTAVTIAPTIENDEHAEDPPTGSSAGPPLPGEAMHPVMFSDLTEPRGDLGVVV
jgi:hypothetical protein